MILSQVFDLTKIGHLRPSRRGRLLHLTSSLRHLRVRVVSVYVFVFVTDEAEVYQVSDAGIIQPRRK